MKIAKQLLLIATFGLCIPFNAAAIHAHIEIDFNNEIAIIESYMPILRNQPTIGAEKVVQWLDKKLQHQSLRKHDAIAVANILTANTSINTKVAAILHIITLKEAKKAHKKQVASQQKRKNIAETVFVGSMFVLFAGLMVVSAVLNPHPLCQACLHNNDYFYLDGSPCKYIHTCYRPRIHCHRPHPSSGVHLHFKV